MAEQKEILQKRADLLAFFNVGDSNTPDYRRGTGFTELEKSKNPIEYSRKYVDESSERTDVLGYNEEMSAAFDRYKNNSVHDKLYEISEDEKIGEDAKVEILVVDLLSKDTTNKYDASLGVYSFVPDSIGGDEAVQLSGTFKRNGARQKVKVTLDEKQRKATIVK